MELVVGTYDELILGFRVVEVGAELQIEASFTDHSHAGCVKCVAISGKGVLASGSTDETIRLLNIKKQKELGSLVHHNGTVTSLQFHKGFLFSTSEDKTLCLWKSYTWECLRTFKGHKAAIDSVSVHPSGKLALTVGRDRALHTWNLITGRSAFVTNLKQVADIVKWSPDGDKYAIVVRNNVNIYSVETAEVVLTVKAETPVHCLEFLNNDVCCYGGEGGCVIFHDITADKQLHTCDTATNRVKSLCISSHKFKDDPQCKVLSIASSEGVIKVYKVTENKKEVSTEQLVEHDTGFRVTCLAVFTEETGRPKQVIKQETGSPKQIVKVETETGTPKKDHTITEHIDVDDESSSSESELSDLPEEQKPNNAEKHSKINKKSKAKVVTDNKLKNIDKKRKLSEVSDSQSEKIKKKGMSGTDKKQKKANEQQDSTKSYDGTVSFVSTAVKKKKFKKSKKKAKKSG